MKILIADDDSVSRRLLQSYLQKWGYEVIAAQDGAEAWRLFEDGQFPMVITDWMMPEIDGSGLLRRIRASPAARLCLCHPPDREIRRRRTWSRAWRPAPTIS